MKQHRKARVNFELLRRTVPIEAILDRYGVLGTLKRSGAQLKGPCPIHGATKSRSFVVNPDSNVWHCFSPACDRGGGMLELVAALEKVDVREAALMVARWFAIKGEPINNHQTQRSKK